MKTWWCVIIRGMWSDGLDDHTVVGPFATREEALAERDRVINVLDLYAHATEMTTVDAMLAERREVEGEPR